MKFCFELDRFRFTGSPVHRLIKKVSSYVGWWDGSILFHDRKCRILYVYVVFFRAK